MSKKVSTTSFDVNILAESYWYLYWEKWHFNPFYCSEAKKKSRLFPEEYVVGKTLVKIYLFISKEIFYKIKNVLLAKFILQKVLLNIRTVENTYLKDYSVANELRNIFTLECNLHSRFSTFVFVTIGLTLLICHILQHIWLLKHCFVPYSM